MNQKQLMIASIIIIFILGFFVTVFKTESDITGYIVKEGTLEYYMVNPSDVMNEYNDNINNVPGFVKTMFGNERINAEIRLNNGSVREYGVITQKGKITSIDKQFIGNATLIVYTNETVLRDLIDSKNQADVLKKDLDTNAISYKAVKFKTKAKTFFAKTFLKAYSFFR